MEDLATINISIGRWLFFKSIFDVLLAILILPILLPIIAIIGIIIKIDSRGPIFFSHERIGRDGKKFNCYKFRTMVRNADEVLEKLLEKCHKTKSEWEKDFKLKDDPRITRIGKFLRKFSLDEIPQIFNILKRDMSFVGPRPIIDDEVCKYGKDFLYYTSVIPGLTGLWQVSGRNDTSYEERVELDKEYVVEGSFFTDIKILFKTIPAVLKRKGAY